MGGSKKKGRHTVKACLLFLVCMHCGPQAVHSATASAMLAVLLQVCVTFFVDSASVLDPTEAVPQWSDGCG